MRYYQPNEEIKDKFTSFLAPNPLAQGYTVANAKYQILASLGYFEGISYLSLEVRNQQEKRRYIVLSPEEIENDKVEQTIEDLLEKLSKKEKIDEEKIKEAVAEITGSNEFVIFEIRHEAPRIINYPKTPSYLEKRKKALNDFTNLVPNKFVHKLPKSIMGGVLGYTYLGENMMAIRDDLYGNVLNEVEIHESIHTDDEYETRVITRWMLDNDTVYH